MAKDIDRIAQCIKTALDGLREKDSIQTKIGIDREAGVIKVYSESSDALKKASCGLSDMLELAYTTAEHHPFWAVLYHATEISKVVLDGWNSDLTADQVSEMSWRCDEIKAALERLHR